MLVVSEREEDVVSLHLPIGPLKKKCSVLEPVPRCEPSSRCLSHCVIRACYGASVLVLLNNTGARCSSVVRACAHGAMGRRIDPSWWTH